MQDTAMDVVALSREVKMYFSKKCFVKLVYCLKQIFLDLSCCWWL